MEIFQIYISSFFFFFTDTSSADCKLETTTCGMLSKMCDMLKKKIYFTCIMSFNLLKTNTVWSDFNSYPVCFFYNDVFANLG